MCLQKGALWLAAGGATSERGARRLLWLAVMGWRVFVGMFGALWVVAPTLAHLGGKRHGVAVLKSHSLSPCTCMALSLVYVFPFKSHTYTPTAGAQPFSFIYFISSQGVYKAWYWRRKLTKGECVLWKRRKIGNNKINKLYSTSWGRHPIYPPIEEGPTGDILTCGNARM